MGIIVSIVLGLVLWIVLWSIGVKGFDAFLLPALIALLAGSTRLLAPYLPGNRNG